MQKISPLRAGLDAFNRFKASRAQKNQDTNNQNSTNPFGISFKGTLLQMDVFESSKTKTATNPIKNTMDKISKFAASARVSAMNKIDSCKNSMISFGNKVKDGAVNLYNKLTTTNVNFDFITNSASQLQKRPVSELEEMFKSELKLMEG